MEGADLLRGYGIKRWSVLGRSPRRDPLRAGSGANGPSRCRVLVQKVADSAEKPPGTRSGPVPVSLEKKYRQRGGGVYCEACDSCWDGLVRPSRPWPVPYRFRTSQTVTTSFTARTTTAFPMNFLSTGQVKRALLKCRHGRPAPTHCCSHVLASQVCLGSLERSHRIASTATCWARKQPIKLGTSVGDSALEFRSRAAHIAM